MARFYGLAATSRRFAQRDLKVIEIGCFDGRALDHLPPVERYLGPDANWENGLDMAIAERRRVGVEFVETRIPRPLKPIPTRPSTWPFRSKPSNISCRSFSPTILRVTRLTNGPFLITVPVEIGPLYLAMHLVKLALYGDNEKYTAREALAATFGRTQFVKPNEHMGFDYRQLVTQLGEWFKVDTVEGVRRMGMPPMLSLTVGIVARPKKTRTAGRRA